MFGFQPSIPPLPSDLSFNGKTALVTGANVGIGLSTCLHLLQHNLSTLLISVRSASKGTATKSHLLSDPIVKSLAVQPTILIYQAEFSDPKSVKALADKVAVDLGDATLDVVVLNAGLVGWDLVRSEATGFEMMFQVNFVSTALLAILLLPLLKRSPSTVSSSSPASNEPARLTFVGSSAQSSTSLSNRSSALASSSKPLFAQLSESASRTMGMLRYGDSKILIYMFVRELAKHVDVNSDGSSRGVVVNDMCPGMVATSLERTMPAWSTPFLWLIKGWRARTPEVGGRTVVYAAALAGKESHGEFLNHEKIARTKALEFIETKNGTSIEKRVWEEMLALTQEVAPGSVDAAGLH
ncbi:NAD-P-binding protein [Stereum hirsutum FP-91666 SS1]|uniref:NAD-P-binding protein n=1 Tax=Stereum hirsutum (strain FP-91666) TaxID=721885 RepID=UPI000444A017|nr:NAD-P-binding protein [Stereum hirsutum FP-91666 SS1]EIM81024.1 NAD-P-binding protein [Stereum hirsutum FP-91666 SS1]